MAIIPFAQHRLIPPGANDPRIKARIGILHVDAANVYDLHDFFATRSGGIESHGHIPKDGVLFQYRDTAYQADANYHANNFALSFETQGFAAGEWTDAQIVTIKRVMLWARGTHGIPLRKVDTWDDPKGGWGHHTLFGAPSHWTPVAKSCPGPERKAQFDRVLVPWMNAQTATLTAQGDDMTPDQIATAKIPMNVGADGKRKVVELQDVLRDLEDTQDRHGVMLSQILTLLKSAVASGK